MTAIQAQNRLLYAGVAVSSAFLLIIALGPGLTSAPFNPLSWHYQIFDLLCHQDAHRSYFLSGVPMAVCARCIGIYSALFAGWMLMPLVASFKRFSKKTEKWLLTSAILVNFIDVTGNFLGFWTNTLNSRFLLGIFLGLAAALFLTTDFFKKTTQSED